MVEAVHFFTKQALSASGLRKYKICFFSACKFAKFAKFTISTSHRFPRQSELWRREKLCTPDRLTEVFLSSVQEWLNGFGFQRSPLDIFQLPRCFKFFVCRIRPLSSTMIIRMYLLASVSSLSGQSSKEPTTEKKVRERSLA